MPVINRNKVAVPDESGTGTISYDRQIKVDRGSGLFSATGPLHLRATAAMVAREQTFDAGDGDPYKWPRIDYRDDSTFPGEVVATTRDEVIDRWESLIYRCREHLTTQGKKKVILLSTEMNVSIYDAEGTCLLRRNEISFAKTSPLVGVSYRICYEAGAHLVTEDNRHVSKPDGSVVIPHSPERETFLQSIIASFERAALQLNEFMQTVKEEPLQIEAVMRRGFLLSNKNGEGMGGGQ